MLTAALFWACSACTGVQGTASPRDTVPAHAPDSTPAWFAEDANWNQYESLERVAEVRFRREASRSQRQAAIDSVGGLVVGGLRRPSAVEGIYYVLIPGAVGEDALLTALEVLTRQAGVDRAGLHLRTRPGGRFESRANWTRIADTVPARAPEFTPDWFTDGRNCSPEKVLKRVAKVTFQPGTSKIKRQAAIDSVGGVVIGGYTLRSAAEGRYYVLIPGATYMEQLLPFLQKLERQPGVRNAGIERCS